MEPNALEKAIFRTLAYFAYFQLPLTFRELHTWLLAPEKCYSLQEIEQCIQESIWLQKHSQRYGVYISLKDTEDWVRSREKKYIDAQRKHTKALRIASWLMHIPGITGIAVCNSLAWHATTKESDIDLFIVTQPGKIWAARFFSTIPLRLLRMRPGEAKQDPVCLSFFIDEKSLDISSLQEGDEDWYLAYWGASLQWIAGKENGGEEFFKQNAWMQAVLPNALPARRPTHMKTRPALIRAPLFIPEKLAKHMQERLFSKRIQEKRNKSSHVVINDHMLKFHDDDRRAAISAFVRLHMQQAGI